MKADARAVIDTSALISRLLSPHSVTADAVRRAADFCVALASEATLADLAAVIGKPKFDPYLTPEERQRFFEEYLGIVELVDAPPGITACRDPSDNKFLDVAVQGKADYLITGDTDLIILHPFMNVAILSPADFLRVP